MHAKSRTGRAGNKWNERKNRKSRPQRENVFVRNVLASASTGGPRALEKLISAFPADIPAAILVVQHMPPGFTTSLCKRLSLKTALRVKEAQEGDRVEEGTVLVAPGNYHMEIVQRTVNGRKRNRASSSGPKELGSRPSVNALFRSIAPIYGSRVVSCSDRNELRWTDGAEEVKKNGRKNNC